MKHKILKCISMFLCVMLVMGIVGCSCLPSYPEDPLPEYQNEYYIYAVKTDKDGTKKGYLVGLTELGQQQTELILPQEIDGIPIVKAGYGRKVSFVYSETVGNLHSKTLKKLYVPFDYDENMMWDSYFSGSPMHFPNAQLIMWKNYRFAYYDFKETIRSYNVLPEFFKTQGGQNTHLHEFYMTNVSYMYNYEKEGDNGIYWADSYDNECISFIPPEPTREGYAFGGWYKEKECINAWDFETDKTGAAIVRESTKIEDYNINDVTFLYAKWIKK